MGYDTNFSGELVMSRRLTEPEHEYLSAFLDTAHYARDTSKLEGIPDPLREAVGLPLGDQGCFFMGRDESVASYMIQYEDTLLEDYDYGPPVNLPDYGTDWYLGGLMDGRDVLRHEDGKSRGLYTDWLAWLVENILTPWGISLNGEVTWDGDDEGDMGRIVCTPAVTVAGPLGHGVKPATMIEIQSAVISYETATVQVL